MCIGESGHTDKIEPDVVDQGARPEVVIEPNDGQDNIDLEHLGDTRHQAAQV